MESLIMQAVKSQNPAVQVQEEMPCWGNRHQVALDERATQSILSFPFDYLLSGSGGFDIQVQSQSEMKLGF